MMHRVLCGVAALVLAAPPAGGQSAAPAPAGPPFTAVSGAFFAVSVHDIEASVRWYTEKLGLTSTQPVQRSTGAAYTVLEGGGLTVELLQLDDAAPASGAAATKGEQYVHGTFKAGLVVADLDRTAAALRARGVPIAFGPFPARSGQRANLIIRDNAGNLIQFFGR
jgi:catechol 2,3-dioxygenase-like lactoylglutathione lyase family enzyme